MSSKDIYPSEFYTYVYRDIDGTPIYVGKGKGGRAWNHLHNKRSHLGNLLRKRKEDGYKIEPSITYHASENSALAIEIFWIAVFGRRNNKTGTLLNLTPGGETNAPWTGKKMSDEHRKKMSESRRGKTFSKESIEKMSKSGGKHLKGKPWPQARRDAYNRKKENHH